MTQNENILEYLKKGNSLTPLDALRMFSCFRLGARIWDLKKQGYNISAKMVTKSRTTFAEYKLETVRLICHESKD